MRISSALELGEAAEDGDTSIYIEQKGRTRWIANKAFDARGGPNLPGNTLVDPLV
jgi:hypothetical protein